MLPKTSISTPSLPWSWPWYPLRYPGLGLGTPSLPWSWPWYPFVTLVLALVPLRYPGLGLGTPSLPWSWPWYPFVTLVLALVPLCYSGLSLATPSLPWAWPWYPFVTLVLAVVPLKKGSHRHYDILMEVHFYSEKVALPVQEWNTRPDLLNAIVNSPSLKCTVQRSPRQIQGDCIVSKAYVELNGRKQRWLHLNMVCGARKWCNNHSSFMKNGLF